MNPARLDETTRTAVEAFQEAEITEYHIYRCLAAGERDRDNSRILAKDLPFGKRFWEMTAISLGGAALSFGIGYLVRIAVGVDI